MNERPRLTERIRAALTSAFNYLNALGSLLLAYALAYPGAFAELRGLLPPQFQPYAPAVAILWFVVVQVAKTRAIARASPEASRRA
jgi:hypothetical protein